jgi:hypothetical protein
MNMVSKRNKKKKLKPSPPLSQEQAGDNLPTGPELPEDYLDPRQQAALKLGYEVAAFEKELGNGKVPLELFTEEELLLPFQRLEAEIGQPISKLAQNAETSQRIVDAIRETLHSIMTPERLQRLREKVEMIAKAWVETNNKWAAALQVELDRLGADHYEENNFILAAFMGQLDRADEGKNPAQKGKKRRR